MPVQSNHPQSTALIVIAILYLGSGGALADESLTTEAFTASDIPIAKDFTAGHSSGTVNVYEIDGIQRIETQLSKGLTADPEQAKRAVLQRFQQLHEEERAQMQRAAMGLAKAMQYGIDRYPAIVFDGELVIYGIADIGEAQHRYQKWREGRMR